MRTTNIFGAFLVAIAMVQGVPLRTDVSPSLSHDKASEHPSDLNSVAQSAPIDLDNESGDGSPTLLVTRARIPSRSLKTGRPKLGGSKTKSTKIGIPKLGASKTKSPNIGIPKLSGSKTKSPKIGIPKLGSSKSKSTGSKSSGSKLSGANSSGSTAAQNNNSPSTAHENKDGDIEEQDSLGTSTDDTAEPESSEEDTEQNSQDLSEDDAEDDISAISDEDNEQDSQDLSEDDTEEVTDDASDNSGIEPSGNDPDETTLEEEISARNTSHIGADPGETEAEGNEHTTGRNGSEIEASTNATFKLARRIKNNRKYQPSTLLILRDVEEPKSQSNEDSRYAEADIAGDTDASQESNRGGDKEQSMGDTPEKRRLNLGGLFKSLVKAIGKQGVEEAASLADDNLEEDSKEVALPEMTKRRSNAN